MQEFIARLFSSPMSIGLVVGILALAFIGKDAPAAAAVKWVLEKLQTATAPAPVIEDDCQAALMCLLSHATRAGEIELAGKLVALIEPVNRLHESEHAHA